LANLKSSKKDIIASRHRRLRNLNWKSRAKTVIRKARAAVSASEARAAQDLTRQASRLLDKAAAKGIIHRRQAARRKSRLAQRLAKMSLASQ